MDKQIDNDHLKPLFKKLREKYGSHRNVSRELGINEDWYSQVRNNRGIPSEILIRLMRRIAR